MPNIPQPRLIPHVISERAKDAPQSIWASIPVSSTDASRGYEDVTFARLNYAITRAAKWLQNTLQHEEKLHSKALAYIGPPDTRYIILTVAAIKTGYKMLFLSPRNSEEAQESVIEQADCGIFLSSQSMHTRVQKLLQSRPRLSMMKHLVVPEQDDLLKDDFMPDFPYNRTVEEARSEPLVVLHTSSTTGIPKTIYLNHGYGMHEDVCQHVPEFEGLDIITRKPFYGACRMFVAMPLYHAGGVLLTLLKSLYHDIVSVFQPSAVALDAEVFDAILRYGQCSGCVIPPYLLEEMLTEPRHFDTLSSLDFVQFGSGPLSQSAGQTLLKRQKNCPHFIGSSECGLYLLLELDDPVADWQYFRFHPWSGVVMQPNDDTNQTYELVVVKSDAHPIPGVQPVFELFPHLEEWHTQDLYVRHPTKSDHWRCIGRNDDILVLSNGEKLNPVDTEGRLAGAHPSVTGVLVIGQGRPLPGLLLEVRGFDTSNPLEQSRLIDEIWPLVQEANRDAPGHGRLSKELILLATADKPFLRTPKLSLRRKPTIDLYTNEIAAMYDRYLQGTQDDFDTDHRAAFELSSPSVIEASLSKLICSENEWDHEPNPEDDLFMLGMDSLQVLRLSRKIKTILFENKAPDDINTAMLYRNPTLRGLSEAIFKKAQGPTATAAESHSAPTDGAAIEALIEEYSHFDAIPEIARNSMWEDRVGHSQMLNVILTGSTGSLGSYILLALLARQDVNQIYCLNRATDAKSRQVHLFTNQGVDITHIEGFDRRVQFLHSSSLGASQLGLSGQECYETLKKSNITHIIHNAWPVNFNIGIESFKSHIAGVRALIDFCIAIPEPPKLLFVSSLSSITSLTSRKTVPEDIIHDPSAPSPMGYGQSKYVAEHVLSRATEVSQGALSTIVLRVGQIAGPVKGSRSAWPEREWLPSLIISSRTINALPNSLGRMETVDWVPVDLLADGICDLLDSQRAWSLGGTQGKKLQSSIFHVVNPSTTTWANILGPLEEQTGMTQMVSLREWIELVRQGPDEDASEHRNPAKKILPFYESLADALESDGSANASFSGVASGRERFAKVNMALCSDTFRQMPSISGQWLAEWAKQWL